MSALGQNGHDGFNLRCPLYLRKRTSLSAIAMSAKCQEQTQAATKRRFSTGAKHAGHDRVYHGDRVRWVGRALCSFKENDGLTRLWPKMPLWWAEAPTEFPCHGFERLHRRVLPLVQG
jgi:hypothetical protein